MDESRCPRWLRITEISPYAFEPSFDATAQHNHKESQPSGVKPTANGYNRRNEWRRGSAVSIERQYHFELTSGSPRQTESLGSLLGQLLRAGDVICLAGDLGVGKTSFSRGVGVGWGADSPLTSPTYNLVHEHRRAADDTRLFHIDCYRLSGPGAADALALDDILDSPAAALLEWPQRIETILPAARLWIDIFDGGAARRHFVFRACGDSYATLLKRYRQVISRKCDPTRQRQS